MQRNVALLNKKNGESNDYVQRVESLVNWHVYLTRLSSGPTDSRMLGTIGLNELADGRRCRRLQPACRCSRRVVQQV
jgi:hypothetical protein